MTRPAAGRRGRRPRSRLPRPCRRGRRDAVEDPFAGGGVVEKRFGQRRLDKGRGDRHDAHALGRQLGGHRLGQPFHRVLGHHVDGAVALRADMAHLRRHVDDDAAAAGDHQPGAGLARRRRRRMLRSMRRSRVASSTSRNGCGRLTPALLTRMSSRESPAKAARSAGPSVTSKGRVRALPPAWAISAATASSSAGVRLLRMSSRRRRRGPARWRGRSRGRRR